MDFEFYNPSDDKQSCVVRTMTKLTGKKYSEVKRELIEAQKNAELFESQKQTEIAMQDSIKKEKELEASIKKIAEAETALKEGFNSAVDRENVLEALKQAEVSLKSTSVTPAQQEAKKELTKKLAETQESVEVSRNYKINQVSSNLDRKSKKVLEIISNILSMKLSKFLVDEIMEEIIEAFERK